MKEKTQLLLWKLIFIFFLIGVFARPNTIDIVTGSRSRFPQMFVYYFWKNQELVQRSNRFVSTLWAVLFCCGVEILFLILSFRKIRDSTPHTVLWTLVIFIFYSLADILGCVITVPPDNNPLYSIIMDGFVIVLSIWSILTIRKTLATNK